MKIKQLYVYPIKSLRGISLPSSALTFQGLQYDRRFMLLKVGADGNLENMAISKFFEMSLFQTLINFPACEITVTYQTPKTPLVEFHPDQLRSLKIPLDPDFEDLEKIEVNMHFSPTSAYKMPDEFNSWFSNCFGFPVVLAYLGDGLRQVLGNVNPNSLKVAPPAPKKSSWLSTFSSLIPLPGQFQGISGDEEDNHDKIGFSDCAPVLVVTESSLAQVHPRLRETDTEKSLDQQEPLEMDIRKFRANIILDGDPHAPWDEDFWGELSVSHNSLLSKSGIDSGQENGFGSEDEIRSPLTITLTANCGRCVSINIDYETGKPGTGPAGSALKKLMKDRRVDKGVKYSPVFGRYGFLSSSGGEEGFGKISVGDEVVVSRRNEERTIFSWPGLTS